MDAKFFTTLFLIVLSIKSVLESVLDKRNMKHILQNRDKVPEKFAGHISLADHQKAADYSVEKIRANQVFHLIDLVVFLGLTLLGGLELINRAVMGMSDNQLIDGLYFFALLGIVTSILSLPKSLYFTFVFLI